MIFSRLGIYIRRPPRDIITEVKKMLHCRDPLQVQRGISIFEQPLKLAELLLQPVVDFFADDSLQTGQIFPFAFQSIRLTDFLNKQFINRLARYTLLWDGHRGFGII